MKNMIPRISRKTSSSFDSIESVIRVIRHGKMVVVTDDEDRENEGDLVMAADHVDAESINFMVRHGRGLICVPTTSGRLRELGITRMVKENRESQKTDFMVSVDARKGITTGISAPDRAKTIRVMANRRASPRDLVQPGHVFPLQARDGGVLHRAGHTEAAVDLVRLAGLSPVGVICEILNDDGSMARLSQLMKFRQQHGLKMCSIRDLIAYRRIRENLIERMDVTDLPTPHGKFRLHCYRSRLDQRQHFALVLGKPQKNKPVLVRVQAECVASHVFQSNLFGDKNLLSRAFRSIAAEGCGILLYMRHEGWGPSMTDSQEHTKTEHLREYGLGAQILADLGVKQIRLLVSHPKTVMGLEGYGLKIVEQVRLK